MIHKIQIASYLLIVRSLFIINVFCLEINPVGSLSESGPVIETDLLKSEIINSIFDGNGGEI